MNLENSLAGLKSSMHLIVRNYTLHQAQMDASNLPQYKNYEVGLSSTKGHNNLGGLYICCAPQVKELHIDSSTNGCMNLAQYKSYKEGLLSH